MAGAANEHRPDGRGGAAAQEPLALTAALAAALSGIDGVWLVDQTPAAEWRGFSAAAPNGEALDPRLAKAARRALAQIAPTHAPAVAALRDAPEFAVARLDADERGLLVRHRAPAALEALEALLRLSATAARADTSVTVVERLRSEIAEQRREFAVSTRLANLGVWSFDVGADALTWSDEVFAVHGVAVRPEPLGLDEALAFYAEEARGRVRAAFEDAMSAGATLDYEEPIVTPDGETKWLRVAAEALFEQDRVTRILGCTQDITEEALAREDMYLLASRDYLTEVANRASFTNLVQGRISALKATDISLFILVIDVDHFKSINDSFGHDVGDSVLRDVTRLLLASVGEQDIVGRLGGDEFGVCIAASPHSTLGLAVAERILERVRAEPRLRSINGGVTLSIGVATVADASVSFKAALKAADLALYETKRAGRNGARQYSDALGRDYEARETIMAAVDLALREDRFEPWYQPKVRLSDGGVEGYEALARWRHPERGPLTPGAFLPALEDLKMATRISEAMLVRAVADIARLRLRHGGDVGPIAVNVTEKMLADRDFAERVADLLLAVGAPPHELEIEVTEAVLLSRSVDEIRSSLKRLSAHGVLISLDDFGTGYASLSHLRAFPIDRLKIDMSFIRDLDTHRENWFITNAVVRMAHDLGMRVVAEGVETAEVADVLKSLGCDLAQGFFFGRPEPFEQIAPPFSAVVAVSA